MFQPVLGRLAERRQAKGSGWHVSLYRVTDRFGAVLGLVAERPRHLRLTARGTSANIHEFNCKQTALDEDILTQQRILDPSVSAMLISRGSIAGSAGESLDRRQSLRRVSFGRLPLLPLRLRGGTAVAKDSVLGQRSIFVLGSSWGTLPYELESQVVKPARELRHELFCTT